MAGKRIEYTTAFRFLVEIKGLYVAGFTEVSGLQSEIELEEYREGGNNGYAHRFPKAIRYAPIVLKRGMTTSSDLWDWYESVRAGNVTRKDGSIIMQDGQGKEVCRWNFFESYPSKWSGPDLSSMSSAVAIESVEIVHNGLKTVFKK